MGPTVIVPGSHRAGRAPDPAQDANRRRNGGRSRANGGAANHSDRVRHTFMIHYAHRMITQKFPPYLKFRYDPEIVARATPRQRRLLGEHAQSNYD